jgi:hypothetical protein
MHISGVYTEADRFQKKAKSDVVVSTPLIGGDCNLCTSSMTPEIAPRSTEKMWQVKGDSKDRDGRSSVDGLYNCTNGRCARFVFVLSEALVVAESVQCCL